MNMIEQFRKEKDFSMRELARRAKLTPSYIHDLEKGLKTNPSMKAMGNIATALDKTITDVFFPKDKEAS